MSTAIVWFRRDLRLQDNPAWAEATQHDNVVALFVLDEKLFARAAKPRQARMIGDLQALDSHLRELGGSLCFRVGDPVEVLPQLVKEVSASAVYVNTDVTPYAQLRDGKIQKKLDVPLRSFWGNYFHKPGDVLTAKGTLSQVFTPFYRSWLKASLTPWPEAQACDVLAISGDPFPTVGAYPLLHDREGDQALAGEIGAWARLQASLERVDSYGETRNTPSVVGTSELSVDLRFGTLSPRRVAMVVGASSNGREELVRQLAWRDWYAHLLFERPELVTEPMKPQYAKMKWRNDEDGFNAWKNGNTGVPFVDAGMRQLNETGWMHNRVRMITASFLVKNLLVDWRKGERYFRHVLLDADIPQNIGNWQWVAGTGPDASPYNRIFNPVIQGQRFDPDGVYVRRWVPELSSLANEFIHEPWNAPPLEAVAAGVVLGETYPLPIVDLAESRNRALAAYGDVKG